ncbi:hypothetical protein SEA_MOLLYMUR_68 [Gordonia phage Mollymur]|uniref:Uncharacterized protein n=1 Tax=Gordonia phage Mollymur TaxID=2590895 RepID=A0A4Y6EA14_9CAUD|nr:hypothetical protein PQB84_gp058 [Gordonia phage Mollymur]QDF15428.1 hypothetical protein SEA_MOLLYMUR_68 [Gordonia phage Mollymur]
MSADVEFQEELKRLLAQMASSLKKIEELLAPKRVVIRGEFHDPTEPDAPAESSIQDINIINSAQFPEQAAVAFDRMQRRQLERARMSRRDMR